LLFYSIKFHISLFYASYFNLFSRRWMLITIYFGLINIFSCLFTKEVLGIRILGNSKNGQDSTRQDFNYLSKLLPMSSIPNTSKKQVKKLIGWENVESFTYIKFWNFKYSRRSCLFWEEFKFLNCIQKCLNVFT